MARFVFKKRLQALIAPASDEAHRHRPQPVPARLDRIARIDRHIAVRVILADHLADSDGSALVFHASADDHTTQPIGGAGDRVACAVIR